MTTKFAVGDRVRYVPPREYLGTGLGQWQSPQGTVVRIESAPGEAFFFHVEWDGTNYSRFTPSVYQAEQLREV